MVADQQKIKPRKLWKQFKMKVNCAYRYELKPNVCQKIHLAKHAGAARLAYNWGLALRIELFEKEKTFTNAIEQHKLLNGLKVTEFPWMYEISKCAPQEALRDLDKAFKNFFRGIKKSQQVGFPKFKKKGYQDSFRLTGTIKIKRKEIQLPRLGTIKLKEDSKVDGKILSATVSREADRWYVSLTVEKEILTPSQVVGEIVGVDIGLDQFAILSNGEKKAAPKPLKKKIKRLKRLSRQHSRKAKGSKNRKKSSLKLAQQHRKIRNIRKDFLHKYSSELTKTKSAIIVEDLDIKGMLRGPYKLNRSIHDVGWGEFRRMLEYKTKWYGSKLVVAPRYYPSSKRCSHCGFLTNQMPLSIREWRCQCCNVHHDRDINAAKNLRDFYTGSSPGIYACGDSSGGGTGNYKLLIR
jgi:putative transposase